MEKGASSPFVEPEPNPPERSIPNRFSAKGLEGPFSITPHSTVTLFARLRGWSISQPRMRAT